MINSKWWKAGALISALILILILWQPLFNQFVQYSVRHYLRKNLGIELAYSEISHEEGSWVFYQPTFSGTVTGSAEKFVVDCSCELWRRHLYLDVQVVNPHFSLSQPPSLSATYASRPLRIKLLPGLSFFQLAGVVTIQEGRLQLPDYSEEAVFNLEGRWHTKEMRHYTASVHIPNTVENRLTIDWRQQETGKSDLHLDALNVDCAALTTFFQQLSFLRGWEVPEGRATGYLDLSVDQNYKPTIVGNLLCEEMTWVHPSRRLCGIVPAARLSFQRGEEDVGTFALLKPAFLAVPGPDGAAWQIRNILGNITLRNLQQATFTVDALYDHHEKTHPLQIIGQGNLQSGEIAIDLLLPSTTVKTATAHIDLHPLDANRHAIDIQLKHFIPQDDWITAEAIFSTEDAFTHVSGSVNLQDQTVKIPFGLILENAPSAFWDAHWIKQGLALTGFSVKEGWFSSEELPFGNYIEPFVPASMSLNLEGKARVNGRFDQKSLVVEYALEQFTLKHPAFFLEMPSKSSSDRADFPGIHYIDFESGSHGGVLIASEAVFGTKNRALTFTDVHSQVFIGQHSIYVSDIQAYCKDVYVDGEVLLDISRLKEEGLIIDAHADTMSGRISHLQELLKQYEPTLDLKTCFDGDLALRQEGADLHMCIHQGAIQMEGMLHGALTDGTLTKQGSDLKLREVSVDFDYDFAQRRLDLSSLQGVVLVGSSGNFEEYALAGDYICLTDLETGEMEFDVWVGDRNRDIVRLVGVTQPTQAGDLDFVLDHTLSHFSNLHPQLFELTLSSDWSQLLWANLQFNFEMQTVLQDFQRFSRTGLLFLSRHLLTKLNELKKIEGAVQFNLKYDDQTSILSYHAQAADLTFGKQHFQKGVLTGTKKDNIWTIDQLLLDDASFAAEFLHVGDTWKINFLGARLGNSFLIGLEGDYTDRNQVLEAKINLFEANLSELTEWPSLQAIVLEWQPKGKITATGTMRVSLEESHPTFGKPSTVTENKESRSAASIHVDAELKLNSYNLAFKEISLAGMRQLESHFNVEVNSLGLRVRSEWNVQQAPLFVTLQSSFPLMREGDLLLHTDANGQSQETIKIHWQRFPEGFVVRSIEGEIYGMQAQLKNAILNPSKEMELVGEVKIDPSKASLCIPKALKSAFGDWLLKGVYALKGTWTLLPRYILSWQEKHNFSGILEGKECLLGGYLADHLTADLSYSATDISLANVHIKDVAGQMSAVSMQFSRNPANTWLLTIPSLTIKDFNPQHMRTQKSADESGENTFTICKLELENLTGSLQDPGTFTGEGKLHWTNTQKRKTDKSFWKVPSEIASSTGLDFVALNPVVGTVHFAIADRRVYLNKFKEMYSAGKLSKFFIPKEATEPSYVDFDGNVSIQVRMRQYNLLFKLAELFVVHVTGTWQNPVYNIQPAK
ncbi:MAG: hypothetical protein H0X51_00555 [Parachlamydiaceae bacterium]|nr:hypothetical protein [Parachlamydiaceae bacterium]